MPEHFSSTMHVFRGEKYRLLLQGGPTQMKRSKILPNGKYDRHWLRTVRQMDAHRHILERKTPAE